MADPFSKRVELAIRRLLIRLLDRAAKRPRHKDPLELAGDSCILLIRHDRLGDAIVSTPVMKLLRESFPAARIDIVLGNRNRTIAPLLPAIDDVFVVERGLSGLRSIRSVLGLRHYDVV